MLMLQLKYQFRQGLFLVPLLVIPLVLIAKSNFVFFLLLQGRFFTMFEQDDFHLILFHISGAGLNKVLFSYNLSWSIWFNAWFGLAQIINLIWLNFSVSRIFLELLNFNIILFTSLIVGNTISNSGVTTIKNRMLKLLASSFIFSITIGFVYAMLQGLELLHVTVFVNLFLVVITISFWGYYTRKASYIKNIKHYL